MNAMTNHSDAELLAAFVDGQLDRQQLEEVTAHLATCEECRGVIGEAAAFEREEAVAKAPRRGTWWAVAAAVVIVVAVAYPLVRIYAHQREIRNRVQALFAAEADAGRPVEARFTDQQTYAKPMPRLRGDDSDIPLDTQVAAYNVLEITDNDNSPAAIRARALAQIVLKQDPSKALTDVIHIPSRSRNGLRWNDIAAAQYGLATREDKPALLKQALVATDMALRQQPKMPEALFNRALILKKMNDPRAAAAINDYLAVDSSSPWADEIRKSLSEPQ